MKRQIRRNVFETNSSSMHSLVIMKQEEKYTPEEISKGVYLHKDIDTGESCCVWEPWDHEMDFGRAPFRVLGTFADKWLYACASLVNEYNDKTYKELVKLAIKYVPGLKKIKLPMIEDGVVDKNDENYDYDYRQKHGKTEEEFQKYLLQKEKDWGLEIKYWKSSDGRWHYDRPYTGHVDEDILSGFLEHEKISIEEYLINKKYVVIQDRDEYCEFSNFKKTGLVNCDVIDHEYPKRKY